MSDRSIIWSATPTPFTDGNQIDHQAIQRMVDHHYALEVDGLFLAGTCGEGPWLDSKQTAELVRSVSQANQGRMKIGVQITENSPARSLERMEQLADVDYDFVFIAQPGVFMNPTSQRVVSYYTEILDRVVKPVGFYDRGSRADFPLETALLSDICAHPMIEVIKDSSRCAIRREAFLNLRAQKEDLMLLNGDEFQCYEYLAADYDGMMTGGAILTGKLLRKVIELHRADKLTEAEQLDRRGQQILQAAYGGETYPCWLTGLKHCLVEMGIFASSINSLGYPLSEECRRAITDIVQQEAEWMLPAAGAVGRR